MHAFKIGSLYHPNKDSWPECVAYDYRAGHHQLMLFYNHPTAPEINAVSVEPVEFALTVVGPVIFVCFRFDYSIPWSEAPFTIHLAPVAEDTHLPEPTTPETRILLQIFMVNAATGVLKAMRMVTFSPAFSRALEAAIQEQQEQPFVRAVYDLTINQVHHQFTSQALATSATITCCGGE